MHLVILTTRISAKHRHLSLLATAVVVGWSVYDLIAQAPRFTKALMTDFIPVLTPQAEEIATCALAMG